MIFRPMSFGTGLLFVGFPHSEYHRLRFCSWASVAERQIALPPAPAREPPCEYPSSSRNLKLLNIQPAIGVMQLCGLPLSSPISLTRTSVRFNALSAGMWSLRSSKSNNGVFPSARTDLTPARFPRCQADTASRQIAFLSVSRMRRSRFRSWFGLALPGRAFRL